MQKSGKIDEYVHICFHSYLIKTILPDFFCLYIWNIFSKEKRWNILERYTLIDSEYNFLIKNQNFLAWNYAVINPLCKIHSSLICVTFGKVDWQKSLLFCLKLMKRAGRQISCAILGKTVKWFPFSSRSVKSNWSSTKTAKVTFTIAPIHH